KEDVEKRDVLLGPGPARGGAGAELVLHVSPRGEVTRVQGQDSLLDRVAGTETSKRESVRAALSEESLKRAATAALGFLPEGKIKDGASWTRSAALDLGALGRLGVEYRYRYEGKGKGEDKNL